jgi:hypothetical protein
MQGARLVLYHEDMDVEDLLAYAEMKGWTGACYVEADDGKRYPLSFAIPLRIGQELEDGAVPCYAEPGLLVVAEMTLEALEKAVSYAWITGFFKSLKPLDP